MFETVSSMTTSHMSIIKDVVGVINLAIGTFVTFDILSEFSTLALRDKAFRVVVALSILAGGAIVLLG